MPLTLPALALAAAVSSLSFPVVDAENNNVGNVSLREGPKGIVLDVAVTGLTPGEHGMHFHEVGDCSDFKEGFKKSGGHINPHQSDHGFLHQKGPHPSDLPNLIADKNGDASGTFYVEMLTLEEKKDAPSLLDKDGSALVIHADPDDYITQPIGGAGDRVACAAVKK